MLPAKVIMNNADIFDTMRRAGFPPLVAVCMTAIAMRESGGDPNAFNGNPATEDLSYGLLQINMFGKLGPARQKQFGIEDNSELFEPEANARAGFLIWNHDNRNLDIAWYITRAGHSRDRFQANLPGAMAAALASKLYV